MSESLFTIEFIGGSQDGEIVVGASGPEFFDVIVSDRIKEIYKRTNDEPPFVYTQIGYAGNETRM